MPPVALHEPNRFQCAIHFVGRGEDQNRFLCATADGFQEIERPSGVDVEIRRRIDDARRDGDLRRKMKYAFGATNGLPNSASAPDIRNHHA